MAGVAGGLGNGSGNGGEVGWRVGTFHIHISHFLFISYFILLIAYCFLLRTLPPPSLSDPAGKKTKVTVYRCSLYSVSLIFFSFFLSFFLVTVRRLSFVAYRCLLILFFLILILDRID